MYARHPLYIHGLSAYPRIVGRSDAEVAAAGTVVIVIVGNFYRGEKSVPRRFIDEFFDRR